MKRRGFTLVEVLVAMGILCMLAAIVWAVVGPAKAKGAQATCLNNISQLTKGVLIYAEANNGGVGRTTEDQSWIGILNAGLDDFRCPEFRTVEHQGPSSIPSTGGYAQNECLLGILRGVDPSRMVLLTEYALLISPNGLSAGSFQPHYLSGPDIYEFVEGILVGAVGDGWIPYGRYGAVRHGGGCLYTFVDGHAKWLRPTSLRLPSYGFGCQNLSDVPWKWKGPEGGPYFSPETEGAPDETN